MATMNPAISNLYFNSKENKYCISNFTDRSYSNTTAIDNAIHYVTRTAKRVDRISELIAWGAVGCCAQLTPDDCIYQFHCVQEWNRGDKKITSHIVHEILTFSEEEQTYFLENIPNVIELANKVAMLYFYDGFQCVYGIHYGKHEQNDESNTLPKLHIHFIINAVNFVTGNLFHEKIGSKPYTGDGKTFYRVPYDTKGREKIANELIYDEYLKINNPFECSDEKYVDTAYEQYSKKAM